LEDQGLDGKIAGIVLKWIFKAWKGRRTRIIWLKVGIGSGLLRMR